MRVARWGNSLAVRIPRALAADAGLEEGTEVNISVEDQALTIRSRPARPMLDDLIARITPENRHEATDWGDPQGAEVW